MNISIKTEKEIAVMREAGKKLAEIMSELEIAVRPGVSTMEIDKLAEKLVFCCGGAPAFKGYGKENNNPFPATICASLNDEVVHSIPSADIILKEGDLFKIDIGMKFKGLFVDMARTFAVGNISKEAEKLKEATERSFWKGIAKMKEGKWMREYSKAVQAYVEKNGFSVVRNLVGHGIGKELHEDPQVPNYLNDNYLDVKLKSGMTLALEPMVNAGTFETIVGKDKWVFKTKDGSLSAHYENTVLVTNDGVEVLTVA